MNVATKNPPGERRARDKQKRTFINNNTRRLEFHEILPHNLEAECNLLNQCLADPAAVDRVRKFIIPKDFYRAGLKRFFERICEFRDANREYTPSLILESFNGDPNFDQFENLYFRICDVYTGGFARHYANIVLENSIKRDLVSVGENLVEQALSARPDVDSILSDIENSISQIRSRWLKKQERHHES